MNFVEVCLVQPLIFSFFVNFDSQKNRCGGEESIQVLQLLIECDLFQKKSRIRHHKSTNTYLLSTSWLMFCLLYHMETLFGSFLSATSWSTSKIVVMQRRLRLMDFQKYAWRLNLTFKQHAPDWSQWNLQRWPRSVQVKPRWLTG